jgi:plasmid stabilization system protein ParE
MKLEVIALRRAETDVRQITRWIAQHSMQGASSWLDAYEELIDLLAEGAEAYPAALEDADCRITLRQALFGTRRGRKYRAIFTIAGDQVRILRVRGPGQPPLQEDELW